MFLCTFRNTIKNIIRSYSFYIALLVLSAVLVDLLTNVSIGYFDHELNEAIMHGDERFEFTYQSYVQLFCNCVSLLTKYAIPLFAIITTVLIVIRDFGDGFFEIEKAAGASPARYLFGRLGTLTVFNFAVSTFFVFIYFYYVVVPYKIDGQPFANYFFSGTIWLFINCLAKVLPCVLFYTCLTYCIGSIFKNGISAAVGSMGYVLFVYIHNMYNISGNSLFVQYFRPSDQTKLLWYLYYYDTVWFEDTLETFDTSLSDAILCIAILLVFSTLFSLVSYLRIRKRTV